MSVPITPKANLALALLLALTVTAAPSGFDTHRAAAQTPPATYYGIVGPGGAVAATIGGVTCSTATAGPDGFWLLTVPQGGACGAADQVEVRFTLNGGDTGVIEHWRSGGAPSNTAEGIALEAQAAASPPAAVSASTGAFVGVRPAAGKLGLLVTGAMTRTSDLLGALEATGCRVQALAILAGGRWRVYIPGAPAAINAAFPSDLGQSAAFAARC